jgi:hypothetical protein
LMLVRAVALVSMATDIKPGLADQAEISPSLGFTWLPSQNGLSAVKPQLHKCRVLAFSNLITYGVTPRPRWEPSQQAPFLL